MPGLARDRRRVSPLTWLGFALLVLLIAVDAVIWFSRSSDQDVFAASSPLETSRKNATRASGSLGDQPSEKPGDYVTSKVTSGGRVVTEHYVVTTEPVTSVQLTIRTTGYTDFSPAIEQLQVFADGDKVAGAPIPKPQALRRVQLGEPSTDIHLRYVTSGGVVASAPSSSGRALALANPVKVQTDAPASRHVIRVDGQVLSLACARGRQIAQPCGKPSGEDGWTVTRNGRKSAVLAQVNTPS